MLDESVAPSGKAVSSALEALDKLAIRFMVEGLNEVTVSSLNEMGKMAAKNGNPAFAARIETLIAAIHELSGQAAEAIVNKGMTDLRTLIGDESKEVMEVAGPMYADFGDDAELVADFLTEAREHLSSIEGQMLTLERDPTQRETVHAVFRAFHTIKGLAGFLAFPVMQAVSHEVETLLDLVRNDKLVIDSPIVDAVLESADFLLQEMASIDRVLAGAASAQPADNKTLIARIRSLAIDQATSASIGGAAEPSPEELLITNIETADSLEPETDNFFAAALVSGPTSVAAPFLTPSVKTIEPARSTPAKVPEVVRAAEPIKATDSGSVRVETAKLDHLMDMVGEMVIAQSLIRHSQVLLTATDSRLVGDLSHLARVTAEVQRATMSMRMVPVAQLFQKIERVIRDLSRKAGKQVILVTSGTDTEVDKTVAEELSDPLLHMVRNSMDHGIETSEERVAAGKNPVAQINLLAYHRGGQIVIEISDDGRGLNADKIRAKAEQKEIIPSGAQLTEPEIYQLIFAPGFSTAETITDVSGRGVGMDVVRRNVEKLRGRIETHSELGHGTTFLLKLPLTLAIIDGLVVEVGSSHYIVPLSVVREIFRPLPETLFRIEGREEMVLVREQLLPIVRLSQRLGMQSRVGAAEDGLLVVIESESKLYCLLVDDLLGKQEVVIKSLGETFKDASGFSGCAVLGDGRVGLILDTDGIYRGRRR